MMRNVHSRPRGNHQARRRPMTGFWLALAVMSMSVMAQVCAQTASSRPIQWHSEPLQGALVMGEAKNLAKVQINGLQVPLTSEGQFVFGIGRDDTEPVVIEAQWLDGHTAKTTLLPIQREFEVQSIDGLDQAMVTPPKDTLARIKDNARQARQARQIVSDLDGFREAFIWPVKGPITGVYGSQRILNGEPRAPHWGIDIAAPTGTPVVSPASGRVVLVHEDMYFSGGTLFVDHGHGVMSAFLHMDRIDVTEGQQVPQGASLGTVGATGRATGPHLDWRVSWRNVRVDAGLLVPKQ